MTDFQSVPAAYHPHLLRCRPGAPVPAMGAAIFGSRPASDPFNRLVYIPAGDTEYAKTQAGLAEFIHATPGASNEIKKAGSNFAKIKQVLEELTKAAPDHIRQEVTDLSSGATREKLKNLHLERERFLGISVADNMTELARSRWTQNGVIQITTCVKGIARVEYEAPPGSPLAFDVFVPFTAAYWSMLLNALVPENYPGDVRKIGTIITAEADHVLIYVDISQA